MRSSVGRKLLPLAGALLLAGLPQSGSAAARHGGRLAAFNGGWMVSSDGICTGLGSAQVTILNGRIIGPNGSGRVTPGGAVHTITNVDGVTTVGEGQITGTVASGTYRRSDGCVGSWSAIKL